MNGKTLLIAFLALPVAFRLTAGGPHEPKHDSKLHAKVALVATSNAPAGARGSVDLEVETKGDHSKSKLKIHTDGLNGGDYVLSAITKPAGSNVVLGPIAVKTDGHVEHDDLGPLASGLSVSNIAQFVLSNSNGVAVLAGDLSTPEDKPEKPPKPEKPGPKSNVKVDLFATTNAPAGARGHLHIETEANEDHTNATSKIKIHTDGLSASNYVLSAITQSDGSNVVIGPVIVKIDGHVEHDDLGALPSGLNPTNIAQFVLSDPGGNAVLVSGPSNPQPRQDAGLHAKIVLIATSNAPAGASGSADLHSDTKNDHTKSKLKIHTDGLNGGDYVLSVITRSDGSNVVLAPITVKTDGHVEHEEQGALPSSLNVSNIAQIVLSDSGGKVVLVGDLVDPEDKTRIDHKVSVDIEPGPGAPDAKGNASLSRIIYHGKVKERFSLKAEKVPADATFQILADGVNVGQVISKHDAKVEVKKLPGVDLSTVHSVQLIDGTSNVILTASF